MSLGIYFGGLHSFLINFSLSWRLSIPGFNWAIQTANYLEISEISWCISLGKCVLWLFLNLSYLFCQWSIFTRISLAFWLILDRWFFALIIDHNIHRRLCYMFFLRIFNRKSIGLHRLILLLFALIKTNINVRIIVTMLVRFRLISAILR